MIKQVYQQNEANPKVPFSTSLLIVNAPEADIITNAIKMIPEIANAMKDVLLYLFLM
jgi:hypothetical protein